MAGVVGGFEEGYGAVGEALVVEGDPVRGAFGAEDLRGTLFTSSFT